MILSITGSSGFVGTNLKNENLSYHIQDIDLLQIKPEEIDFNNSEALLHLAALVHQMRGAPEQEYYKVNSDLAFETAKHAKENGVKHFLFMSTVKVFGEFTDEEEPWKEDSPCFPLDPYGKSKLEGEQRVKELEDKNFTVSIIRTPLVYGPGVRANMLNLMKLVNRYPVIPLGNINNKRSMTYVGNLVHLIDTIIKNRKSGIFLASDGEPVSTSFLVNEIAQNMPGKKIIVFIPGFTQKALKAIKPDFHQRLFGDLVVDNQKTREALNWHPKYSFSQGVKSMVGAYQESLKMQAIGKAKSK
jgi:UDP-glucose 4-epimerase